ncbi:MAG TPA: ThuA domain-containing protein, partial [Bacteroidota bacterium]
MAPLKRPGPGKDFLMIRIRSIAAASMLGLLFMSVPVLAQLSQDQVNTIREAAPVSSTVKPKQPRLLLVFNRAEGYKHSAIPCCAQALEILGKKTGAYESIQSEDVAMFLPENLKRFDAVCLNNTTQLKFDDPVLRKSLLDFVAGGKGIIGIHSATDNFPTWSEGQELLGGVFDGHPWTADGTWQVKIEDPASPLNASFAGKDFLIKDEIYRIRQIDLRKNCRVLLGLDMKAERNRAAGGVRSTDRDIPISWVRTYGRGRLFYCSLGHNDSVYMNPAVLRHYLDGIQYALGDLECETTPRAFDPTSFFDGSKLSELLRRVSEYQYGESRAALTEMNTFVRGVDDIPEARRRMEREFLEFLKGSGTSAGKQFICTKLGLIGSEASAGQLSAMLSDTSTAEMALAALEGIGGSVADAALAQALTTAHGRTLIGVITALGNRRVVRVTPALEMLASHGDPGAALAAVAALGKIGTPAALDGLSRMIEESKGEIRAGIPDAMLSCAGRLRAEGDTSLALSVYNALIRSGYPAPVRSAALRGIVVSDPGSGAKLIRETLSSGDASLHGAAARLLAEIPDIASIRSIAGDIAQMAVAAQVQVLSSLALYPDEAVRNAVAGATAGKSSDVRIAALRTLGVIGDAGAVQLLA